MSKLWFALLLFEQFSPGTRQQSQRNQPTQIESFQRRSHGAGLRQQI